MCNYVKFKENKVWNGGLRIYVLYIVTRHEYFVKTNMFFRIEEAEALIPEGTGEEDARLLINVVDTSQTRKTT